MDKKMFPARVACLRLIPCVPGASPSGCLWLGWHLQFICDHIQWSYRILPGWLWCVLDSRRVRKSRFFFPWLFLYLLFISQAMSMSLG